MKLQQTQKELVLQILDIIHYAKDKEKFIKEFEAINYLEAVLNMLERLPNQIRETLRETVKNGNVDVVKKYVTPDEYIDEVNKTANEAITKFVAAISPVLNLDQKQKIHELLK